MPDEKTFKLKYVGPRFAGRRLPVDVLVDLSAFRDLVVAFAKDEWRKLNAGRKRVPRGFDASISFDLVGIEDGSAVPNLSWNRNQAQSFLPDFSDRLGEIVDTSFKSVVSLMDEAGHGRFPKSLPTDYLRPLITFGSRLLADERIEFKDSKGSAGNVVYLDAARRRQLITHIRGTYQSRVEGIGKLITNDHDGSIWLRTDNYGDIEIPVGGDKVTEIFDGNLGADVQFDLQVELDISNKFRSVIDIFHIGIIDSEIINDLIRCRLRLADIADLEAGWHNDAAAATDPVAMETAKGFLSERPFLCSAYRMYPSEDGSVLLEFEANLWDFAIEFQQDGAIEMYGVQIDGTGDMEPKSFRQLGPEFLAEFDSRVRSRG